MKTAIILVASVLFSQGFVAPTTPRTTQSPQRVSYDMDGHYWTVYLVATLLKNPESRQLAYYAQLPDCIMDTLGNVVKNTNTWAKASWQKRVHALTGGNPEQERNCSADWVRNAPNTEIKGTALHRLGDSYAHARKGDKKMFPYIVGHLFAGHKPDEIKRDTAKYMKYVYNLIGSLGGRPETTDLTCFQYIVAKKLNTPANIEILKSEIYIQNHRAEYCINNKESKAVEDYLNSRKAAANMAFTITAGSKKTPATVKLTFN